MGVSTCAVLSLLANDHTVLSDNTGTNHFAPCFPWQGINDPVAQKTRLVEVIQECRQIPLREREKEIDRAIYYTDHGVSLVEF